jgi:hypothetical protein
LQGTIQWLSVHSNVQYLSITTFICQGRQFWNRPPNDLSLVAFCHALPTLNLGVVCLPVHCFYYHIAKWIWQVIYNVTKKWWDRHKGHGSDNSGWGMLCTRPTRKLDFYSASSLKQQSRIDMSSHLDTLSWFRDNQSLLLDH